MKVKSGEIGLYNKLMSSLTRLDSNKQDNLLIVLMY